MKPPVASAFSAPRRPSLSFGLRSLATGVRGEWVAARSRVSGTFVRAGLWCRELGIPVAGWRPAGEHCVVQVRKAEVADAAGIATVHVRSWQAAYRGLVPDHHLDGLDIGRRTERWTRYLTGQDPLAAATLVAVEGSGQHRAHPRSERRRGARVLGFADVGGSRDADAAPGTGELFAIYVLPAVLGGGVGRALIAAAVTELRRLRCTEATLWVLDGNHRARRFYQAAGWRADGAHKDEELAGTTLHEVRYRRGLLAE